jgi:hypothetical protein
MKFKEFESMQEAEYDSSHLVRTQEVSMSGNIRFQEACFWWLGNVSDLETIRNNKNATISKALPQPMVFGPQESGHVLKVDSQ